MKLADPQLEASFLGCCLDLAEALDSGVTAEHMTAQTHRQALASMHAIRLRGEPVDDVSVRHELERRGMPAGAALDLVRSLRDAPMVSSVTAATTLRRLHEARTVHECATVGAAHASAGEVDEAREHLARGAFHTSHGVLRVWSLRDAIESAAEAFDRVAREAQSRTTEPGRWFTLGLGETLDGCFRVGPGDTVIVAAETNVGKSSLAMTSWASFERRGIPFGLVSVEDPQEDWGAKALGHEADIDTTRFWTARASEGDWRAAMDAAGRVAGRHQYGRGAIASSGRLEEVMQAMSILVRVHGCRILWVDYIQAIAPSGMERAQPKQQIDHVYRSMQALARQLGVPLVIGSQFSRGDDDDKEPTVKRLKESGNLENGAQAVFLFWVDKDDREKWDLIRGKAGKLKRSPVRPRWAMRRGPGGVLHEVPMPEPKASTKLGGMQW